MENENRQKSSMEKRDNQVAPEMNNEASETTGVTEIKDEFYESTDEIAIEIKDSSNNHKPLSIERMARPRFGTIDRVTFADPVLRPTGGAFVRRMPVAGSSRWAGNLGAAGNSNAAGNLVTVGPGSPEDSGNLSLATEVSSGTDTASIEQRYHPSDFLSEGTDPRGEYVRRRTQAVQSADGEEDDGEEEEDEEDEEGGSKITEHDLRRGFHVLSQPDPRYLGFIPSQSDTRPYLAALPLVTAQPPSEELCAFHLPISFLQRVLVFCFVLFVLICVGLVVFFMLSKNTDKLNAWRKQKTYINS